MSAPQITYSQTIYRFSATLPDGSVGVGTWCKDERTMVAEARAYAEKWLSSVQRLGMHGQAIRIETQTRFTETRQFTSRPKLYADYSKVETDQYGNIRGIS